MANRTVPIRGSGGSRRWVLPSMRARHRQRLLQGSSRGRLPQPRTGPMAAWDSLRTRRLVRGRQLSVEHNRYQWAAPLCSSAAWIADVVPFGHEHAHDSCPLQHSFQNSTRRDLDDALAFRDSPRTLANLSKSGHLRCRPSRNQLRKSSSAASHARKTNKINYFEADRRADLRKSDVPSVVARHRPHWTMSATDPNTAGIFKTSDVAAAYGLPYRGFWRSPGLSRSVSRAAYGAVRYR